MAAFAYIKPLPVSEFIERMNKVCIFLKISPLKLNISTDLQHHSWNLESTFDKINQTAQYAEIVDIGKKLPSLICTSASLEFHGVNPTRQYQQALTYILDREKQVGAFELKTVRDKEMAAALAIAIQENFNCFTLEELYLVQNSEATRGAVDARRASVASLDAQVERLTSFLETLATQQSEHVINVENSLTQKFEEKERKLDQTLIEKVEHLDRREGELKKQEEQYETNNAKYVRRDHLKQLQAILAKMQESKLSPQTILKRKVIHRICIASMVFFGSLIAIAAARLGWWGKLGYELIPLFSIGASGFAVTLIYYVRWNDAWFSQHAQNELTAQKMGLDVVRASWLAELLFDWETERQQDLPEDLRKIFSEGLFVSPAFKPTVHPAEELTNFLGRLTAIRAGADKIEIEAKSN